MKKYLPLLSLVTALSGNAYADTGNQIPSCYAANKMEMPSPAPQHEIFIMLDETTPLDDNLKGMLAAITNSLIKPGAKFSILSFSAFAQGRYLNQSAGGVLELPLAQNIRSSIGAKVLKNFDACMAGQARYGLDLAFKAEKNIVQLTSADLQKSDVIASLTEVSRQIKGSTVPKKTLLIVSDMLENSTISSFYVHDGVRKIDPEKELKTVEANKLLGDFGGASVYVMGAGLMPIDPKNHKTAASYRDPKTMGALKSFWQSYFQKSNAKLVEFGEPALLGQVE